MDNNTSLGESDAEIDLTAQEVLLDMELELEITLFWAQQQVIQQPALQPMEDLPQNVEHQEHEAIDQEDVWGQINLDSNGDEEEEEEEPEEEDMEVLDEFAELNINDNNNAMEE